MSQSLRLRGISGDLKGKVWESDSLLRVGRLGTMEVVLDEESVSRRHAEVRWVDGNWSVRDLGSTNGTYLNGVRLDDCERLLLPHDIVQFGKVAMIVQHPVAIDTAASVCIDRFCISNSICDWHWIVGASVTAANTNGQERLELVLRSAMNLFRAQRGGIVLSNNDGRLEQQCSVPPNVPLAVDFCGSVAEQCLVRRESLLVRKSEVWRSGWAYHDSPTAPGLPTATGLFLLLQTARNRLGAMFVMRDGAPEYSEDDLRMADALAAHWSEKIERALRETPDPFVLTRSETLS